MCCCVTSEREFLSDIISLGWPYCENLNPDDGCKPFPFTCTENNTISKMYVCVFQLKEESCDHLIFFFFLFSFFFLKYHQEKFLMARTKSPNPSNSFMTLLHCIESTIHLNNSLYFFSLFKTNYRKVSS